MIDTNTQPNTDQNIEHINYHPNNLEANSENQEIDFSKLRKNNMKNIAKHRSDDHNIPGKSKHIDQKLKDYRG